MSFFSWLRKQMLALKPQRPTRRAAARFRPLLDQLEGRDVPSAVLLADIMPGSASSDPASLTDVNGTLYFVANDATHGAELWKSDGTAAGTTLVKDIRPGSASSNPANLINVNGTLFFTANDGEHGLELWKSDGTEHGTTLVKDIGPGVIDSTPLNLTDVNGTLYFTVGSWLYKSNGLEAGTTLVKSFPGSFQHSLTDVAGTLYFSLEGSDPGTDGLWKSDGRAEGTVRVKPVLGRSLTNVDGTLFFVVNSQELWRSDGSEAGTVFVKHVSSIADLTAVNDTLYFGTFGESSDSGLWKSNGTPDGTVRISAGLFGGTLTNVDGTLYINSGPFLSKYDGNNFVFVTYQDSLGNVTNVNGRLFFTGSGRGYAGYEVWTTAGLGDFGALAADIFPGPDSSYPANLTTSNGSLFFVANDGIHGRELWRLSQFVRDDAARTTSEVPVEINVLANDFRSAGATITASTSAAHGSAVLNADGSFTYTPNPGFSGVDMFTYTVTNRFGDTDTATVTVTVIQPVQIDIKPGSSSNAINLNNDGTISVAVFGTADFDARTVDLLSVRFAGAAAIQGSLEDVNHDGKLDMVLHFRIADTNLLDVYRQLLLTDAADGTLSTTREQTTLLLSGSTTGGGLWEGLDAVTLFETGKTLADLLTALGLK